MQGLTAKVSCEGTTASASIPADKPDGVVEIKLNKARKLPAKPIIDLAFILDTTGSMSEEIEATKSTVQKVAAGLGGGNFQFRIGMVTFKDRTDGKVTEVFQMTTDIPKFGRDVQNIGAAGGGDVPESVNEGVHVAMTKLAWGQDSIAKLAFLIGDAPPHLDYQQDADYAVDMRDAAHRGIKLFTIAASGMDALGQVVWRQMAHYTGATNMFVLRGGAGPQSTGGGDPTSSCGGTQTNFTSGSLDILISRKVEGEMRALDRSPLKIAGLGLDENAKPCKDRIQIAGD
jgi:Mg-chelatase subunit ChlD